MSITVAALTSLSSSRGSHDTDLVFYRIVDADNDYLRTSPFLRTSSTAGSATVPTSSSTRASMMTMILYRVLDTTTEASSDYRRRSSCTQPSPPAVPIAMSTFLRHGRRRLQPPRPGRLHRAAFHDDWAYYYAVVHNRIGAAGKTTQDLATHTALINSRVYGDAYLILGAVYTSSGSTRTSPTHTDIVSGRV